MCGCNDRQGHTPFDCSCSCHELKKYSLTKTSTLPVQKDDTVLEEAAGLIYGDRQQQYGNAKTNFGDIARLWEPIIGKDIGAEAVALCLLQLKVARAVNDVRQARPIKRDTIVDLAGYAGCIEKIQNNV